MIMVKKITLKFNLPESNLKKFYLFLFLIIVVFLVMMFFYPLCSSYIQIENPFVAKIISDSGNFYYSFCKLICHQRIERSIIIGDCQTAFCIRCFMITVGMAISELLAVIKVPKGNWISVLKSMYLLSDKNSVICLFLIMSLFMFPMLIDGFSQIIFDYESNVFLRIITGLLFGYFQGTVCLVILSSFIRRKTNN